MYCFKNELLLLRKLLLRVIKGVNCTKVVLILSFVGFKFNVIGQRQTIKPNDDQIYKSGWLNHVSVGFSFNHTLLRGDAYGLSRIGVNKGLFVTEPDNFDLGYGLRFAYQVNSYFDLGLEYNQGSLTGSKEWETNIPYAIWSVDGAYSNVNIGSRLYLSKFFTRSIQPRVLFYGDLAFGIVKSKGYVKNITPSSSEHILEYNSGYFTTIGAGVGIEYRFSKLLSIDLGTKLFYDNSDDLDGINESIIYNAYHDTHWISHLGLNIDLSDPKANRTTRKWHLRQPVIVLFDSTNIVSTQNQDSINFEYVFIKDTVYLNRDKTDDWFSMCEGLYDTSVFFNTSSPEIKFKDEEKLIEALNYLINYPKSMLLISGFADKSGRRMFNLTLSEDRVNSVYNWFINKGVSRLRVRMNHYGEDELIYDIDSENRRVDIKVIPYVTKPLKE